MHVNGITSIQKTNHHEKATEKTEPQQEDDLESEYVRDESPSGWWSYQGKLRPESGLYQAV